MPPRGFRKLSEGIYRAERVVYLPKKHPLTGNPYEAAFYAMIRRIAGDGWRLALEHTTDSSDIVEPTTHDYLSRAADAAEKAGWL
jgi:hypothetical protein